MLKFNYRKTFEEYLKEWITEQKNYIKESTYANYSNLIYNHIIPILRNT